MTKQVRTLQIKILGSWLYTDEEADVIIYQDAIKGLALLDWQIPNFLYSPENIFSNNIPMLDVNFLAENRKYSNGEVGSTADTKSISQDLSDTIADWYKGFRNIAVVGLLTVLIYLGIRIVISSAASEKAKYKESIKGWVVALALVFVLQFIMAGIIAVTESVIGLFSDTATQGIVIDIKEKEGSSDSVVKFNTNLMGYIRFMSNSTDAGRTTMYTIMYVALIAYTFLFTFTYLKRVLYMAFFTMISPLVALTYPIDKAGDGQAQAFNMWFKEFTMNAIIQPVHLILYTMLVTSAIDISIKNPLYGLVAIGFLIPAEKFIKKMFGMDKASTPAETGSVAAGAAALTGIATSKMAGGALKKLGTGKNGPKGSGGSDGSGSTGSNIRMPYNANQDQLPSTDDIDLVGSGGGAGNPSSTPSSNPIPVNQTPTGETFQGHPVSQTDSGLYIAGGTGGATQTGGEGLNEPSLGTGETFQGHPVSQTDSGLYIAGGTGNAGNSSRTGKNPPASSNPQPELGSGESSKGKTRNAISNSNRLKDYDSKMQTESGLKARAYRVGTGALKSAGRGATKWARDDRGDLSLKDGAKNIAKGAAKVGGIAAGATVAGTIAAGATLATGDPSKFFTRTAGGIAAGSGAGLTAANKSIDKVGSAADSVKDNWYTDKEKLEKAAKKSYKNYANEDANIDYLVRVDPNIDTKDKAKEYLASDDTKDYLKQNITDINTIYNARKLEQEKGLSRQHALVLAKEAEKMKTIKSSASEQKAYQEKLREKHSSQNAQAIYDAVRTIQKTN